jgi:predicted O-methyltransferase YrrM
MLYLQKLSKYKLKLIYIGILIIHIFIISINFIIKKCEHFNFSQLINFPFHHFENEIVTQKMKELAGWELTIEEVYFINGIIRKIKPKRCLEIGVSEGGSSILILNSIRDLKDSILVSLDIREYNYKKQNLKTGYRVKQYFPELITDKNWKLYTGNQPHIFLDKIQLKFDFLYLDTVHSMPGEVINIIEALPFLEENCTIILHDILYHFFNMKQGIIFHPSNIFLFTALQGYKIIQKENLINIGAIMLFPNQQNFYLNYFYLLLSPWQYLPDQIQFEELKKFIQKYYQKDIYIDIFNTAYQTNKLYLTRENPNKTYNNKNN